MSRSVYTVSRAVWFRGLALAVVVPVSFVVVATRLGPPSMADAPAVAPTVVVAGCADAGLPTLGGLFGQAVAANQRGIAVGTATDAAGASHAVVWRSGHVSRLSTGTTDGAATGVNTAGDVIGTGRVGTTPVGWVWSRGATTRLSADPDESATPSAINDRGLVVGALSENEGTEGEVAGQNENEQAAFWQSASASPTVLRPLAGDQGGSAFAVDNRGRIGGVSAGTGFRPVIWDAGRSPHALAGLGGGYGAVRALADSGLAVGDAVSADGVDHPVRWDASGRITQLDLPAGARSGQALAILPDATVLGVADVPLPGGGVQKQAVRWTASSAALLSTPERQSTSAPGGATDATSYVGYRTDAVGGRHPVLWRCGR
jgi:hypothetical protein